MKNKLRNLEDIQREKQKLLLEIGIHEYALNLNFRQIKSKFTFLAFSVFVIDIVRARLRAKIPSLFSGILRSLWRVFVKKK
jgi:hypothetical protein